MSWRKSPNPERSTAPTSWADLDVVDRSLDVAEHADRRRHRRTGRAAG